MGYTEGDWRRIGAGHYKSPDGRWAVRSWVKGQWWAFRGNQVWGGWRQGPGWRRYVPFRTKRTPISSL